MFLKARNVLIVPYGFLGVRGRCNLYLEEKIYILKYNWPDKLLNKSSELITRCSHKSKSKL